MFLSGKFEGQSLTLTVPSSWKAARNNQCTLWKELDLYSPTPMIPFYPERATLRITGVQDGQVAVWINQEEYIFASVKRGLTPLTEAELKELMWDAAGTVFFIN